MLKFTNMVVAALEIGKTDRDAGIAALDAALDAFDAALDNGEIKADNLSFRALVDRKIAELQDF